MSFYFSRVSLRSRVEMSEDERGWLRRYRSRGDAELDHALLWRLFPGDNLPREFVFRREAALHDAARSYFVVSSRVPQADAMFTVRSKLYAPQLEVGEALRFDLRANPVVTRKADGARHDVLMDAKRRFKDDADRAHRIDEAALAWLMARAPHWGLKMQEGSVRMDGYHQYSLTRKNAGAGFSSLDYSGLAQVEDAELLATALTQGVGHQRGYGCGLLLVKRV